MDNKKDSENNQKIEIIRPGRPAFLYVVCSECVDPRKRASSGSCCRKVNLDYEGLPNLFMKVSHSFPDACSCSAVSPYDTSASSAWIRFCHLDLSTPWSSYGLRRIQACHSATLASASSLLISNHSPCFVSLGGEIRCFRHSQRKNRRSFQRSAKMIFSNRL